MEVYRKVAFPKTLANPVALHGVSERVKIGTNSLRLKILHRDTTCLVFDLELRPKGTGRQVLWKIPVVGLRDPSVDT